MVALVNIAVTGDDHDAPAMRAIDGCACALRGVRVGAVEQHLVVSDELQAVGPDHRSTGRRW